MLMQKVKIHLELLASIQVVNVKQFNKLSGWKIQRVQQVSCLTCTLLSGLNTLILFPINRSNGYKARSMPQAPLSTVPPKKVGGA